MWGYSDSLVWDILQRCGDEDTDNGFIENHVTDSNKVYHQVIAQDRHQMRGHALPEVKQKILYLSITKKKNDLEDQVNSIEHFWGQSLA